MVLVFIGTQWLWQPSVRRLQGRWGPWGQHLTSVHCLGDGNPCSSDVISSPGVCSNRYLNRLWCPALVSLLLCCLRGCFCCPLPQGLCFRVCQRDSFSVHSGRWRPVSEQIAHFPQRASRCCCNTFALGLLHPSGLGEAKGTQGQMIEFSIILHLISP